MNKKIIIIAGVILAAILIALKILTAIYEPRAPIEDGLLEETAIEEVAVSENQVILEEVVEEPEEEGPDFESVEMVFVSNSGEEYTVLSPEYKNPYVEKIREEAGVPEDVYPNSTIVKLSSGDYAWYYDGNGGEVKIYNLSHLSSTSVDEFLVEFASHTATYVDMVEAGKAPKIDLDEDGQITFAEIELVAIYVTYDPAGKAYVGAISLEDKVDREVWW